MSREDCVRVLAGARLARLACAHENQPYVVPVYLAYDEGLGSPSCLYGFTTPGQKIEWMRANPLVCIEVDDVSAHDRWVSVIAFGRFEELPDSPENQGQRLLANQVFQRGRYKGPDTPGRDDQRLLAHQVLQAQALWWEQACASQAARPHGDRAEPFLPVYYRVCLDRITGYRATPDPGTVSRAAAPARRMSWLRRLVGLGREPRTPDEPEPIPTAVTALD